MFARSGILLLEKSKDHVRFRKIRLGVFHGMGKNRLTGFPQLLRGIVRISRPAFGSLIVRHFFHSPLYIKYPEPAVL